MLMLLKFSLNLIELLIPNTKYNTLINISLYNSISVVYTWGSVYQDVRVKGQCVKGQACIYGQQFPRVLGSHISEYATRRQPVSFSCWKQRLCVFVTSRNLNLPTDHPDLLPSTDHWILVVYLSTPVVLLNYTRPFRNSPLVKFLFYPQVIHFRPFNLHRHSNPSS